MPVHCVRGQTLWFVPLRSSRRTRRALHKLCRPSQSTDPSASAGRQDKAEDPDALQSLAGVETTAGRVWSLTMDVAAAAAAATPLPTTRDESPENGEGQEDVDEENLVLQQRLEDLSLLQSTQMQQLAEETKQTKQDAVAALMGRVSTTVDDQSQFSAQWLQREERILEALMSIVEESDVEDDELRGLINDACTPPEESKFDQDQDQDRDRDSLSASENNDNNTEQMWTTPMALAAAIDRAVSGQADALPAAEAEEEDGVVDDSGRNTKTTIQRMAHLRRIRKCLLDIVDPETRAWLADR